MDKQLNCLLERLDEEGSRPRRALATASNDKVECNISHFAPPLQSGHYSVELSLGTEPVSSNYVILDVLDAISITSIDEDEIFLPPAHSNSLPVEFTLHGTFNALLELTDTSPYSLLFIDDQAADEETGSSLERIPLTGVKFVSSNNASTESMILTVGNVYKLAFADSYVIRVMYTADTGDDIILA